MFKNIIITGTGAAIPNQVVSNVDFLNHNFLNADGTPFEKDINETIGKFKDITGIEERRYAEDHQNTSDLATQAANEAILNATIDKESIDLIIVAHNFGDVSKGTLQGDFLPCLAAKVKHNLEIQNPNCVAFDILFGCPGWVQAMIQAIQALRLGDAKKALVIGAETLSRVVDHYDRDSMIFADGAGATILEVKEEATFRGVINYGAQTYALEEAGYLYSGKTFHKDLPQDVNYIKMNGRKIYEFALNNVPLAMKSVMDKDGLDIDDISKIFIHQANEKMDEAIIKRLFRLFRKPVKHSVMPMSIQKLGNNSVATVPILYHLVKSGNMPEHQLHVEDYILFASVGAGMNINAITYKQ